MTSTAVLRESRKEQEYVHAAYVLSNTTRESEGTGAKTYVRLQHAKINCQKHRNKLKRIKNEQKKSMDLEQIVNG